MTIPDNILSKIISDNDKFIISDNIIKFENKPKPKVKSRVICTCGECHSISSNLNEEINDNLDDDYLVNDEENDEENDEDDCDFIEDE